MGAQNRFNVHAEIFGRLIKKPKDLKVEQIRVGIVSDRAGEGGE